MQDQNSSNPPLAPASETVRLGLLANWRQFTLLVLVNAFVGGMVGLERAIVPLLAAQDFGLASKSVILAFIISFGVVKALANLFAGQSPMFSSVSTRGYVGRPR